MTSRRFFIGPIPAGWLQHHRKSWYKRRLKFRNYTSRTVTFSPDPVGEYHRRNSDLDMRRPDSLPRPATFVEDLVNYDRARAELESEHEAAEAERELPTELSEPMRAISEVPTDTGEPSQSRRAAPRMVDGNYDEHSPRDTSIADDNSISAGEQAQDDTGRVSLGQGCQKRGTNREQPPGNVHWPDTDRNNMINGQDGSPASESDDSRGPLLRHGSHSQTTSTPSLLQQEPEAEEADDDDDAQPSRGGLNHLTSRLTKYNLDDHIFNRKQRLKARIAKHTRQVRTWEDQQRHRLLQEGEIVKAEAMLVQVEEAVQKLPSDYSERDSMRVEARPVFKWREYLVVCRRSHQDDSSFLVQMYRTHVIPAIHKRGSTRPSHHEIFLDRRVAGVNLYSSLDKTIALWHPSKYGSRIYIMRSKSAAHSVEWYTFFLQALGWRLPSFLPIYSPDLDVSLVFRDPFKQLQTANSQGSHETFVATAIIQGCMETLETQAEWADILRIWSTTEKMGLAWKRYDRLEWVYGLNEEKMLGTVGMQKSHDLEVRPRQHYPTTVKDAAGKKEEEPPPAEGFLIRLTSRRGAQQRMNKMFYKRLYFFTQDRFLLFCRPNKATPPSPPRHPSRTDTDIPSSEEILETTPLSYDVDPYPVENGELAWLSSGSDEYIKRHDEDAYAEAQRNVHNLTQADGYIDLCEIREVRHARRGSSPADVNIRQGPDIEYHYPENDATFRDDGHTDQFNDEQTFELALDCGLVVRLQAYSPETKEEWMKRLEALSAYWKKRAAADAHENKSVKEHNIQVLDIDEEMEAMMGQFAKKWELKKAEASPYLHNMCALAGCRTIRVSDTARKIRVHFY